MSEAGRKGGSRAATEAALEEFRHRWDEGEALDPELFCRRFPGCGPLLRERIGDFLFVAEGLRGIAGDLEDLRDIPEPPPPPDPPAEVLGDFRLLREIGRGGMGVVYEGEQLSLGRTVALKVLPAHVTLEPRAVKRFRREASTTARLRHPGIIEVHAVGDACGAHYFAMPLVEGAPLDRVIEDLRRGGPSSPTEDALRAAVVRTAHRPMCGRHSEAEVEPTTGGGGSADPWRGSFPDAVARIVLQVAEALEHAHRCGVLHRDVKPSNILVRPNGTVVLTDFGLAREQGQPSLTMTGEFAGTPYYVAPEQARIRGGQVDRRSDLYSLGTTLYELLTLTRPFDGPSTQEVLTKIISETAPVRPRKLDGGIPRDLETICLKAIEKEPARRYSTCRELADDLRRHLDRQPVKARPIGRVHGLVRLIQRNPVPVTITSLAVSLVLAAYSLTAAMQDVDSLETARARTERDARIQAAESILAGTPEFDPLVPLDASSGHMGRRTRSKALSIGEALSLRSESLERAPSNEPQRRAQFLEYTTLASACRPLGMFEEGQAFFDRARELLDQLSSPDHRDQVDYLLRRAVFGHDWATAEGLEHGERNERLQEAKEDYEVGLTACDTALRQGDDRAEDLRHYRLALQFGLGVLYQDWGDFARAEAIEGQAATGGEAREEREAYRELNDRAFGVLLEVHRQVRSSEEAGLLATRLTGYQLALLVLNQLEDDVREGNGTPDEWTARINRALEWLDRDSRLDTGSLAHVEFSLPRLEARDFLAYALMHLKGEIEATGEPRASEPVESEVPPLLYIETPPANLPGAGPRLMRFTGGNAYRADSVRELQCSTAQLGPDAHHSGRVLVSTTDTPPMGGPPEHLITLVDLEDKREDRVIYSSSTSTVRDPCWHPDGSRIYFVGAPKGAGPSAPETGWGVYWIDLDGEEPYQAQALEPADRSLYELSDLAEVSGAIWIGYQHYPWTRGSCAKDLWVAKIGSGASESMEPHQITSDTLEDDTCQFGPDGRSLYWLTSLTLRKFGQSSRKLLLKASIFDGGKVRESGMTASPLPLPSAIMAFSAHDSGIIAVVMIEDGVQLIRLFDEDGTDVDTVRGQSTVHGTWTVRFPSFMD